METSETLKKTLKQFEYLKQQRTLYESLWKETTQLVNRRRFNWDLDSSGAGKTPTVKIFDSTAADALETFSGGIQGYAVSPAFKWFKAKLLNDQHNDLPFVRDWMEILESGAYSTLNMSNFYDSFDDFVKDAGATGTAYMFTMSDPERGMIFSTRHPKECFIEENYRGEVDTLFRYFKVSLRSLVQQFGVDALHQDWKQRYQDNEYDQVPVLHAVKPRGTKGITRKKKAFSSEYIDMEHQTIIYEGGYDDFPYVVWRLGKTSDEVYGRGLASSHIPEILRVNQMAKTLLMSGEWTHNPPWMIPTALQGREKLIPGGKNFIDPMRSGEVKAIQTGGQLSFGYQEFNDQRENLKNIFYVNFFLMMESIQNQKNMTATEVMEKQSEKAAILGNLCGRLNSEVLYPIIDKILTMKYKALELPPPPDALLQVGGEIVIEFMGPLAQAQRRFNQNQGIQGTIALARLLVETEGVARQSQSQVLDNFDFDVLADKGAQTLGAPEKAIRERPEVEKMRIMRAQAEAQAQAQAQTLEAGKALAQNADKLNQPMQKGSMLESVAGGK